MKPYRRLASLGRIYVNIKGETGGEHVPSRHLPATLLDLKNKIADLACMARPENP